MAWFPRHRASLRLLLACAAVAGTACASTGAPPGEPEPFFDYFQEPSRRDRWSSRIIRWQLRERAGSDLDALRRGYVTSSVVPAGRTEPLVNPFDLADKYLHFQLQRRRALVEELLGWLHTRAADEPWALECGPRTCPPYALLREAGFSEAELFRAELVGPAGQRTAVVLWFEDPRDPWVIRAHAAGLQRLSGLAGWRPRRLHTSEGTLVVAGEGP